MMAMRSSLIWISPRATGWLLARIQINEDRIAIAVTREANVYDFMAGGGGNG